MMHTRLLMAAVLASMCLVVIAGGEKPRVAAGWESDYAQAKTIARRLGKPMFVVFR